MNFNEGEEGNGRRVGLINMRASFAPPGLANKIWKEGDGIRRKEDAFLQKVFPRACTSTTHILFLWGFSSCSTKGKK